MRARGDTPDDGRTLTVRVPLSLQKRGGRKQVVLPDGGSWGAPRARVDNTMVKAIARAHRWRRLLESGQFSSGAELAEAKKINDSYLARVLRLTLLAPDIVEAVLDGRQPRGMTLAKLMEPFPAQWDKQWPRNDISIREHLIADVCSAPIVLKKSDCPPDAAT